MCQRPWLGEERSKVCGLPQLTLVLAGLAQGPQPKGTGGQSSWDWPGEVLHTVLLPAPHSQSKSHPGP